jgi:D-amino peptidase
MHILISADMEGVCGVTSWVQVLPPELGVSPSSTAEYERARARMTREVNAAVEGALEGGAEGVIVNDAHDGMRNLLPEELHPEVRFVSGSDKPLGMMQGVQEPGIGAVFFVGYHAKAGTPNAPLAHTMTSIVADVRLDGRSTGEYGINAAVAGHFGLPVALVTGDERAVAQVHDLLGSDVVGVAVKRGYSNTSALHLHPGKAQALIRSAATQATRKAGSIPPWRLPPGCAVEVDFDHQTRADQCTYLSGIDRTGERTVAFAAEDGPALVRTLRAVLRAGSVALSP